MNIHADPRRDAGMSLPELLLGVVMVATITGALATALVVGLRATDGADGRVARSVDRHIVSTLFAADVHSADTVATTGTCGALGSPVLALGLTDGTVSGAVVYAVSADAGSWSLVRRECTAGTLVVQQVVARKLASGTAATVTCVPAACSATPSKPAGVRVQVAFADGTALSLYASRRAA